MVVGAPSFLTPSAGPKGRADGGTTNLLHSSFLAHGVKHNACTSIPSPPQLFYFESKKSFKLYSLVSDAILKTRWMISPTPNNSPFSFVGFS